LEHEDCTSGGCEGTIERNVDQVERDGPIVITRNGRAVAVLLGPMDDDDLEGLILARSPRFQALLEKSRRSIRAGKGLPHKKFWTAVAGRAKRRRSVGTMSGGKAA
jgi:PHD/YefM family antitoxin component YafN of YafNO toxin-antitoxin module